MKTVAVIFRSVHEEERCFALGLQFVILRLFGKHTLKLNWDNMNFKKFLQLSKPDFINLV